MRVSPVPILCVLLLVALVYLAPGRSESGPSRRAIPVVARLDLTEPPQWALQRGTDPIARRLDRLAWGHHMGMVASRDALRPLAEDLAPEILARLDALGDSDPVQVSKLVTVLADQSLEAEGVLDELNDRARSRSSLVTMRALRGLAYVSSPGGLNGIYPRLDDDDPSVRRVAHAALAKRAAAGDSAARDIILEELERSPSDPELAYLAVLESFDEEPRAVELLNRVAAEADFTASLVAWSTLLRLGDEAAAAHFEQAMVSDDHATRMNSLRVVATAGRVLGAEHWATIGRSGVRDAVLTLGSILKRAVDTGHEDAPAAKALLEELSSDPLSPVRAEFTDVLYEMDHPWAIEQTRLELRNFTGVQLSQTVDRVVRVGGARAADMVTLSLDRLEDRGLRDVERALLCRLITHTDPARAAEVVVGYALEEDGTTPELADALIGQLGRLGEAGIERLGRRIDEPRAAALFVYTATQARNPLALPYLEQIVLDEGHDLRLREDALDAMVRIDPLPAEQTLRRTAEALPAGEPLRERARLLFWNYL